MLSARAFHRGIRRVFLHKRLLEVDTKLWRVNAHLLTRNYCQLIHPSSPPVFDSKVGFVDYEKEVENYRIEVPKFYNFANVLDDWASQEEVSDGSLIYLRIIL